MLETLKGLLEVTVTKESLTVRARELKFAFDSSEIEH